MLFASHKQHTAEKTQNNYFQLHESGSVVNINLLLPVADNTIAVDVSLTLKLVPVTFPLSLTLPETSSFSPGLVVPMPTLPEHSM
jgi:hypothetical protein